MTTSSQSRIQFRCIWLVAMLLLLPLQGLRAQDSANRKAGADLRAWKTVLETYYVDWLHYPEARDIREAAAQLQEGGYWDNPVTQDPWGREYRFEITSGFARVSSSGPDGHTPSGDLSATTQYHSAGDAGSPITQVRSQALPMSVSPQTRSAILPAFGPEDFVRASGLPQTETRTFPASNTNISYTLQIENGGSGGQFNRTTVATVTINGSYVFGPDEFNQTVPMLEKSVTLAASNTLSVEIKGKPGSGFTLRIFAVILTPPCVQTPYPGLVALCLTKPNATDVDLAWSPVVGGHTYNGTRATNAAFFSAATVFAGVAAPTSSFTYLNGQTNSRTSEFFDVTDSTEPNAGGKNNGGNLPPMPPTVNAPPSATLYIGQTNAQVTGTNFSEVFQDNIVWFEDSPPAFAAAVSPAVNPTTISFTIPPGTVSGSLSVSVGNRVNADPVKADVYIENPVANTTSLVRSLSFANAAGGAVGDYWFSGTVSGVNGFFREYFDSTTTKTWLKEDRSGTFNESLICSPHPDRFGHLYCARTTLASLNASSRWVATSPPGVLQNCIAIGGGVLSTGTEQVQVIGVAADPNPSAIPSRDVAYFAFWNNSTSSGYIVKINISAAGCVSIADRDFGNTTGFLTFPTMVGMSVDLDGNLYYSRATNVQKITPAEVRSTFKSGFSNLLGLDVDQDVSGGPVYLQGADFGVNQIRSAASDDPAAVRTVNTAASPRAVVLALASTDDKWDTTHLLRKDFLNNDGINLPIRSHLQLMTSLTSVSNGKTWISSPVNDPLNDRGDFQEDVKRSSNSDMSYSTVRVEAWWQDGIARPVCVRSVEPISLARYEPPPADVNKCDLPWTVTGAVCDNKEAFSTSGAGSFTENNDFQYCTPSACGANQGSPCKFHLRISQKYAGDNYKVYLSRTLTGAVLRSTGFITAWKHAHIETDDMCRAGGIIGKNASVGDNCIYFSKRFDNSSSLWFIASQVNSGNRVEIFDSSRPIEGVHDSAYAWLSDVDFIDTDGLHYEKFCLQTGPNFGDPPYNLQYAYSASPMEPLTPHEWSFTSGNSAGACITGSAKYSSSLVGTGTAGNSINVTAGDAFTHFHFGGDGSSTVPPLPKEYDDGVFSGLAGQQILERYHQLWFKNKNPTSDGTCGNCYTVPDNYFHLIGMGDSTDAYGVTLSNSNLMMDFVLSMENGCAANPATCSSVSNLNTSVSIHECSGHGWEVNQQSPCVNGHDAGGPNSSNNAWCGSSGGSCVNTALGATACLMSAATSNAQYLSNLSDGINRFDCEELFGAGAYCGISSCGGVGIRTHADPK